MTKEQSSESITLYYRDGGSDKVYTARIEAAEGGHVVNFAFGRRGNTLQTGTKTPKPVDYDTARKAYDKLVRRRWLKATPLVKTAPVPAYLQGRAGHRHLPAAPQPD